MLTLEEAKNLLAQCKRDELRDHAFGDTEICWTNAAGVEVANGYFGGSFPGCVDFVGAQTFSGADASALRKLGITGTIERNDSAGPDQYQEGQTMPGLTREGVRAELEKR